MVKTVCLIGMLCLSALLAIFIYDSVIPKFTAGQCVKSTRGEEWESSFIERIDIVGKKKYRTTTFAVHENKVVAMWVGDLDFFIQSSYKPVPCPSELSR